MIAPILSVEPGMGDNLLILTFVVIVIGGIGSIRGAFIAALLIGVIDTLGRSFGPQLAQAVMAPAAASQTGRSLAPMLIYILMAARYCSCARADCFRSNDERVVASEVAGLS